LRAEANLCVAIRAWAAAAEGGELIDEPGLVALRVDAPLRAFNQAILTDRGAVTRNIATAVGWFEGRSRFRIRLREELAEGHDQAIVDAGLAPHGGIPSLALSSIGETAELETAGITIRTVDE
jgi:hypothetical protein